MATHHLKGLSAFVAAGASLICVAVAAPQTDNPEVVPRQALKKPPISQMAPTGDQTLKSLLAAGYEIIHVDAPIGTLSARFILRQGTTIFSCEPQIYRSGSDPGKSMKVISPPCLNLTPDK